MSNMPKPDKTKRAFKNQQSLWDNYTPLDVATLLNTTNLATVLSVAPDWAYEQEQADKKQDKEARKVFKALRQGATAGIVQPGGTWTFTGFGGREFTYEIEPFVGIFGLNDASAPSIVKFMKSEVNPQLIASGIEDADFLDSPLRMGHGHDSYASGTEKIAFDFLNNLSSSGATPMLLKGFAWKYTERPETITKATVEKTIAKSCSKILTQNERKRKTKKLGAANTHSVITKISKRSPYTAHKT